MNISLNWLRDFVDWSSSVPELETLLTRAGIKVESVTKKGADFPKVVIAQILESAPHPNADRLSVCRVDDGSGHPRQIVCGAKNYRPGDKVPLALPGAVLTGGLKIKVGKLRGVESEGMLCSEKELGLGGDTGGLFILPPDAPVGSRLTELYPPDTIFELEITPNRSDWLSHAGLAREISVFSKANLRRVALDGRDIKQSNDRFVSVRAPALCPFYSLRRVRAVKVGPSPRWLVGRLEAVGLRSINNVVDITNYVMLELGQPLHAFDASKVHGEVIVRQAFDKEKFRALDGNEYLLSVNDLVIADADKPIALAGVMGGAESGVTDSTSEILLESAFFAPSSVRRSAASHNLHSESSYRFEREVDPSSVVIASVRATRLIEEVAGSQSDEKIILAGTLPFQRSPVILRPSRCGSLLGANLTGKDIREALIPLGLVPVTEGEDFMEWEIPSFRRDLSREADLIEEVARVIGIERIPGRVEAAPAPPSAADEAYDFRTAMRGKLYALGLSEARTSTLVSDKMRWRNEPPLRLRNPLGEDHAFLRTSLLPGLITALQHNIRHGAKSVALYEIGRTFHSSEFAEEQETLAFALYGEAASRSWRQDKIRDFDWYDAKGVLECLTPRSLTCIRCEGESRLALCVELLAESKPIGILGQLAPAFARQIDAIKPVLVAEVSVEMLRAARSAAAFREIPRFPAVIRDIAVMCPLSMSYGDIEGELRKANEELLVDIEPFDVYRDPSAKKLPADRKSIAISLTFRARERTLDHQEVNTAFKRLKEHLKTTLEVDFRE
jgi:phenylalanyl-tRNA synthetase beta chain